MSDEKKSKEKPKGGKWLRWFVFLFFFGGAGGGAGYYFKPEMFKKVFHSAKDVVQNTLEKIKKGHSTSAITIKGNKLSIEIATTHESRQRGLMNRKTLPEDQGMLFVYRESQTVSFWMKKTLIPLSIAFIREDGEILQMEDMGVEASGTAEEKYKSYRSDMPVKYALEVNQGWFKKKGIQAGDKIEGLSQLKLGEVE